MSSFCHTDLKSSMPVVAKKSNNYNVNQLIFYSFHIGNHSITKKGFKISPCHVRQVLHDIYIPDDNFYLPLQVNIH